MTIATHKRYCTPTTLVPVLTRAGFIDVQKTREGDVCPHVFAEFFSKPLHSRIKNMIGLLRCAGVVNINRLRSNLFFVARKSLT